ncbi:glycine oxidase ThiO [Sanguibacter sp. YZGR15]|uniref:glycine oxidase n=1 Tax=Sanguibacter suaedae TaxID=2795737 RepID=A0A934I4L8_9MICO|nr:glycine oxidase ThiO [Sanguibacter suaedae]
MLVVGGGIVGLVAAWRAALLGLSVVCLDPDPGSGATHAAAGMLAPVTEATFGEEALTALCVDSAARWPAFAAELEEASGLSTGLRTCGTLAVSYDQGDAEQARRMRGLHQRLGLSAEEITVAEARELEPFLGPRLSAAYRVSGDHQVDPRATHRALLAALDRMPHVELRHVAAAEILRSPSGDVLGAVDVVGERHVAGTTVVAAGVASGDLLRTVPGVDVPVRGVKGQSIRLDASDQPSFGLRHVVRGTVQMRPVYVVPRPGGEVVVGATSEERSDHDAPSAGGVHALLRDARVLVPGIDELAFLEVTARARPAMPDNLPLLGATDVPGLVVATGHHRNGILLAPLTAAVLEATLAGVADGTAPPLPDAVARTDARRFSRQGVPA